MRRILVTVAVVAGSLPLLPASPAGAHAVASETYTVVAPAPLRVHSSQGGCIAAGVEDIHKDSHPILSPTGGVLRAQVTGYTGDWDLGIVDDATGKILVYSAQTAAFPTERVQISVAPNQAVSIVACNYTGGPTATASFTFSPKLKNPLTVGDLLVWEGDVSGGTRNAMFTVSLAKPKSTTVTVAYTTAKINEQANSADFTPKSGTLSFAPGVVSLPVKVPITPDTAVEGNESFKLVLSAPSGAVIGDGEGIATIIDDDPSSDTHVRVSASTVHEGDTGTRTAYFTVGLNKPATTTVTVDYRTEPASSNSATAPADYTATSGTLSFAPGTTSAVFKVPVVGDNLPERDEVFWIAISQDSWATIAAGSQGTIIDDV